MVALEPLLRREIVEIGSRLAEKKYVQATYGSISAKLDSDIVICTPAGVAKENLGREKLVKAFLGSGRQIGGGKPTSMLSVHAAIYAHMQYGAIIHAQPNGLVNHLRAASQQLEPGASSIALVGQEKILVVGGACADRAAKAVAANHESIAAIFVHGLGVFALGKTLSEALVQLEQLDAAATSSASPVASPSPKLSLAVPRGSSVSTLAQQIAQNISSVMNTSCGHHSESTLKAVSDKSASSCTGCGRCAKSGGVLPSAEQQAAQAAIQTLSDKALIELITAAAREVLNEKGLL